MKYIESMNQYNISIIIFYEFNIYINIYVISNTYMIQSEFESYIWSSGDLQFNAKHIDNLVNWL